MIKFSLFLWRKIMPFFYSPDFHLSVLKAYQEGTSTQQELADLFHISISTVKRILKRYQNTGSVLLNKSGAGRPRRVDDKGYQLIRNTVQKNPSVTLASLQKSYYQQRKIHLSLATICRVLQSLTLNRKKVSHYAQEQERNDVKKKISV
jgi:transposase